MFAFETRRLVRGPLPWGGAALCLGLRLYSTWEWLPDMRVDPAGTSGAMLVLAAAMMLAANLAAARDTRGGMPETLAALPVRAAARATAATLAAVAAGTLIALAVMGGYLLARTLMGPVAGAFDPWEALGGVLVVPFAAALGAALARWAPWPVMVPVAALTIGALVYFNSWRGGYGGWFLPVVLFDAPDWPPRPSALHVLYLLAATVLLTVLVRLRHERTRTSVIAGPAAAAVAVASALAAGAAAPGQEMNGRFDLAHLGPAAARRALPPAVRDLYLGPGARVCRAHGPVIYCALRDYAAWIPSWIAAVDPVVAAIPPARRPAGLSVRQSPDTWWMAQEYDERVVETFMVWGRAGAEAAYRGLLASDVISRALKVRAPGAQGCEGGGRSRTLVALWLLGQVVAPGPAADREIRTGQSTMRPTRSPLGFVRYGAAELGYARRLLATPQARQRIWAHWDTLVDPATPLGRALPLLGLRAEFSSEPARGRPCE
ncbi:hypothetical protein Ssi03_03850 [Sphaerisporangium siamense]|nr:hypothetical protein Ssi03_03850 [Sphaerisporangium siamense]